MVTVQVLPDAPGQFPHVGIGLAVSKTELPTANVAMHVPGQLIPPGRLVTDPLPTTATLSGTPPRPIQILAPPPVPAGSLAETPPPPQKPGAGDAKPAFIVTTPSST